MKYINIFSLFWADAFNQRARSFVWFSLSFINPLVALLFWQSAFHSQSSIAGWNLAEIRSYYLFLMIAQAMLVSHIEYDVAFYDIKEGNIVANLLRPERYLLLKFFLEIPWRLIQGSFAVIALVLVAVFTGKSLTVSSDMILISILCAVLGFSISFLLKMILAIIGFWITEINGILELNDMLLIMLSGVIMPVVLLPHWTAVLASYTPFPYIVYWPVAGIIGKTDISGLVWVVLIQMLWIICLYVVYKMLWTRGVKKFSGVGQ